MQATPAVSVVIPLFNKGPHIARAIQSVLNQTEQNFEIIIVDGHSTDEGPIIVKSFQDMRILFFEQMGAGVSSARNEGIEYSQSDFIAFLDADDEWMPDHLETLQRLRKTYPEAGACTTAYLVKYPNFRIKMANFHAIPKKPWEGLLPSYFKSAAFGSPPVWTSAVGIPKKILKEIGKFNAVEWFSEDLDLWTRIAIKHPIAFSWEGKAIYHTEATNRICNCNIPLIENLIVVKTLKNLLESDKVPLDCRDDIYEYIAIKQIETAWVNYLANYPDLARRNLKECETKNHLIKKYWILIWTYIPINSFHLILGIKNFFKRIFTE